MTAHHWEESKPPEQGFALVEDGTGVTLGWVYPSTAVVGWWAEISRKRMFPTTAQMQCFAKLEEAKEWTERRAHE